LIRNGATSDWVRVGRVGRPHGLDGHFVVERPSDDPARYVEGARVWVGHEPARVVSSKRVGGGRLAVRLDRPVPRGAAIEVPRSELAPTAADEYYVRDLVGLEVVEQGGRTLGTVTGVYAGVANDALELDSGLALPLVEDCVLDVDLEGRRVVVAEGFAE
jgi:16S rRNA processing protein RimM